MEHRQVHGRPNVMLTPRLTVTPSPSLSPTRTPIARGGPGYCLVSTPSPAADSAAGSILLGVRLDQTYAGGMERFWRLLLVAAPANGSLAGCNCRSAPMRARTPPGRTSSSLLVLPGAGAVRGREVGQDIVGQGVLGCCHRSHAPRHWKNPWMVSTMGVARITPTRPTVA